MFHLMKQLNGYKLRETDGEIGELREVYFDDQKWRTRYFIVETGSWLFGRKVLISPVAVTGINYGTRMIAVNLTREQVKHSPDISTDAPISRQMEARLNEHYGWPEYWGSSYAISPSMNYQSGVISRAPYFDSAPAESKVEREINAMQEQHIEASHLRSSQEVTGYQVSAQDGTIGHVDDFIIDDMDWSLRYFVLDADIWMPGLKKLLATDWIESINWDDTCVYAKLQKTLIANSPPYDPSQPITREYETQLFQSYHQPVYWEETPVQPHILA